MCGKYATDANHQYIHLAAFLDLSGQDFDLGNKHAELVEMEPGEFSACRLMQE